MSLALLALMSMSLRAPQQVCHFSPTSFSMFIEQGVGLDYMLCSTMKSHDILSYSSFSQNLVLQG